MQRCCYFILKPEDPDYDTEWSLRRVKCQLLALQNEIDHRSLFKLTHQYTEKEFTSLNEFKPECISFFQPSGLFQYFLLSRQMPVFFPTS